MSAEDFVKYKEIISFLEMTIEKAIVFERQKQPMLSAECLKCAEKIVFILYKKIASDNMLNKFINQDQP